LEPTFEEKIAKIQKYLPEGLTEKILSQRDRIEGERKQVTVMFCDMEGFTPLVEKLGAEEAYLTMDRVYEMLIHKVHDYEGTVNEMTGDGIMALFGAPIALEDAPQRAIRAAVAIHREMARFSDRIKKEDEGVPALKMRVGIHTGPVVVGTMGNDLRVEFKAVGETVNLASRMESLAKPGTTYVTEDTYKLTEGFFRFEALGKKEVKGKKEAVSVYRAIAASSRRTRFDISAERGLTPFVGRERELELLLDGFTRAKSGRGQAFSIVSEAGLGKSRLLYEFRKAVTGEDVMFLEGRCLSYSRGVAYHPVVDIFKANFDIADGDRDSEARQKVLRGLHILGADEATTLPYLLELLSIKDSGIDKIPMSPEARKDRIMEAAKRTVLKGSEIRPLILAFEDLHWMDKSSEDLLKYVFENIPGARVLLIFTYRPEFVHTWGGKSYHNQITLNRLSNRESLLMTSHLLGIEEIGNDLEELILAKTEGVPFFIEELIRSLKDLKIIERKENTYHLSRNVQEATIPSTVQEVIMARVDSLPDGAKEVLQTGSVIEREFSYELIKRLTDLPERELLSHLSVLKDSELLYERGIYPQSTYIFKHSLTREVVYDSILSKKKRRLHEEIANAIEELYRDSIEEHYGTVAVHFLSSGNYRKSADYSKSAMKKALKAVLFNDAIDHAKKAVFCLEKLERTEAVQREIIDARTDLAGCYLNVTRNIEAKEAVEPVAELAEELDYPKGLTGVYTALGAYNLWVEEDHARAYQYLKKVVSISEETRDHYKLWYANWNMGLILTWNCEFKRGLERYRKVLNLSEATNNSVAIATVKSNMSANHYFWRGKMDLAFQTSLESLKIAEECGDIFAKGAAYMAHGASCFGRGLFPEAAGFLTDALTFSEKMNESAWGSTTCTLLGDLYTEQRMLEKAQNYLQRGIAFMEKAHILFSFRNCSNFLLKKTKVLSGDSDMDPAPLREDYQQNRLKVFEGWIAKDIGEILMSIDHGHLREAEEWIRKAVEADSRNEMRWHLGRDYALYAELCKRKGEPLKAKENLDTALEIFNECGADGWVKKYEQELAYLS
jgi:class 3 adenylate cyclase/tetratricopeptide (TPR) repeat protein